MMPPRLPVPPRFSLRQHFGTFSALAVLALLAGCAGGLPGHSARQAEPPQPPLEAKATFFANTISATAQVAGFGRPFHGPGHAPDREDAPGERPPGGGRGRMGHGPGGGGPGGGGGPREAFADRSRPSPQDPGTDPRQTLRVSFSNTGTERVDFTIAELRSAIGNFQPQPEHLTLAPGAGASLDPVSGDAGGALEWIDVTLTLRHSNTTETRILHLTTTPAADSAGPSLALQGK